MRIQQISVTGLFGIFNHVIPLNMNDRITIVHGPNGFGKTAMLRLLNGFFNSDYSVFQAIPFITFNILFDNDNHLKIFRILSTVSNTKTENIIFNLCDNNSDEKEFSITLPRNIRSRNSQPVIFYNNVSKTSLSNKIIPQRNYQTSIFDKVGEKSLEEPEWLIELKGNISIRLIESQRLLNTNSAHTYKRQSRTGHQSSSMLPTVSTYSDEIAQIMRNKFSEYGAISQSLDRTFPSRLVQRQLSPNLTDEQLRSRLEQLEKTRSRLIEVGLLDKTENPDFPVQPPAMDESTKNILSVYIDDVEKKLSVFNDVANKIELLRNIINIKFAYSYKEMNFSKNKGFVFRTLYQSSISDSDTLSPTDLSSGEQHELVLLYELLFKVEPKSLVLIDEPELSLHVGWQVQFLKDLQDIVKLADLDILMATHSPDIIQDRWDLTVELKGQEK
jgi:predicted ATP-binding protein involved in virulence